MFPAIQLGKLTTAPVSPERAAGDTRSACLVGVSGNSSVTPGVPCSGRPTPLEALRGLAAERPTVGLPPPAGPTDGEHRPAAAQRAPPRGAGAEIRVALRSRDDVVGCRKGSLLPSVAVPVTTRQRPLCGLFDVAAQAPDRNALRSWLDRAPAAPFGLPAPGPRWGSGVGRVRPIVLPLHGCAPEDALVGASPLLLHLE